MSTTTTSLKFSYLEVQDDGNKSTFSQQRTFPVIVITLATLVRVSGSEFYCEIIDKDNVTERGESFRSAIGIFKISLTLFSNKLHLSKLYSIISKNLRGAKPNDSISNFLRGISISSPIRNKKGKR